MKIDLIDGINKIQINGAGEIILSSIDNDGVMKGFDFEILDVFKIYKNTFYIDWGCSNIENIKDLFHNYKNVAAGCSSLFIFKGKLKAVLINYPSEKDKEKIFNYR